jgi:hypothetical protein
VPKGEATARGYVSFRGIPLAQGTIVFTPDRDRGTAGKVAAATLASDGSYQLTNLQPGWYRVAISDAVEGSVEQTDRGAFPAALRRPDLSGLERELKAGQINIYDFLIELTE